MDPDQDPGGQNIWIRRIRIRIRIRIRNTVYGEDQVFKEAV